MSLSAKRQVLREGDLIALLVREIAMTPLKYRVREFDAGWQWEMFTEDGRTVASGTEPNQSTARAAAMLQGIHVVSPGDDPSAIAAQ
jgi:hypothetical protein